RALLFQIMNFGWHGLEQDVVTPALGVSEAELRLRTIIAQHAHLITSRSTPQGANPVTIVMDEVSGLTPGQRSKINQRKRAYVELIRETLRHLQASGKLGDLDVGAAASSLIGMMVCLARCDVRTGRLS